MSWPCSNIQNFSFSLTAGRFFFFFFKAMNFITVFFCEFIFYVVWLSNCINISEGQMKTVLKSWNCFI